MPIRRTYNPTLSAGQAALAAGQGAFATEERRLQEQRADRERALQAEINQQNLSRASNAQQNMLELAARQQQMVFGAQADFRRRVFDSQFNEFQRRSQFQRDLQEYPYKKDLLASQYELSTESDFSQLKAQYESAGYAYSPQQEMDLRKLDAEESKVMQLQEQSAIPMREVERQLRSIRGRRARIIPSQRQQTPEEMFKAQAYEGQDGRTYLPNGRGGWTVSMPPGDSGAQLLGEDYWKTPEGLKFKSEQASKAIDLELKTFEASMKAYDAALKAWQAEEDNSWQTQTDPVTGKETHTRVRPPQPMPMPPVAPNFDAIKHRVFYEMGIPGASMPETWTREGQPYTGPITGREESARAAGMMLDEMDAKQQPAAPPTVPQSQTQDFSPEQQQFRHNPKAQEALMVLNQAEAMGYSGTDQIPDPQLRAKVESAAQVLLDSVMNRVTTKAEYDELQPGDRYFDPQGRERIKR